ncbi:hypothetical protein BKP54_16930 [Ensifer sp. 1H6]|nr:hypothetical protein BKP54_16930 [Ensifer sp. 1H6]
MGAKAHEAATPNKAWLEAVPVRGFDRQKPKSQIASDAVLRTWLCAYFASVDQLIDVGDAFPE